LTSTPTLTPTNTPTRTSTPTPTRTSTPTPTRTLISLYQNGSEGTACDTTTPINVYMDTPSFATCNILYANLIGPALASAGWYTDGNIYRYWDGSNFGVSGFCSP
jgi:hypothetical protein